MKKSLIFGAAALVALGFAASPAAAQDIPDCWDVLQKPGNSGNPHDNWTCETDVQSEIVEYYYEQAGKSNQCKVYGRVVTIVVYSLVNNGDNTPSADWATYTLILDSGDWERIVPLGTVRCSDVLP